MKTIIWKELREHARWIPLGVIPMIIILVLKWRSNELIFEAAEYGIFPLSLSSLVGLVASGVALCLGILQSWPDQRPAARALLLHRGITANAAFCGKLLAGLLLYTIAVIVPLLGMAMFIASVGIEHRAASPGALLPAALISIAAFSCWPTSLLVVQREAWILGSRFLPGLTAALAVLACGIIMHFALWLAIVIAVVTLASFLAAARSVFVNSSHVATGAGRVGLTLAVTMALLSIAVWLVGMIESYRTRAQYISGEAVVHRYVVEFGPDGSPWLTRSTNSWNGYRYDFDRLAKMVPGESVLDDLQSAEQHWEPQLKWSPVTLTHFGSAGTFGKRFQSLSTTFRPVDASVPSENVGRTWVYDAKLDAILVYRSAASYGRFQLEAKLPPPLPVESFGEVQSWVTGDDDDSNFVFVTTTGVYLISTSATDISLVFSWPKTVKYRGVAILPRHETTGPFSLALRLDGRVVLLENELDADTASRAKSLGTFVGWGETFATEVRLPAELAKVKWISVARDPAGDGTYLGLEVDLQHNDDRATWFRFSADGQIEDQERYGDDSQTGAAPDSIAGVVVIPPFAFALGLAAVVAIENSDDGGVHRAWEYTKSSPSEAAMILLLGMLQPLFGILLAIWAARRRSLDKWSTRQWICWVFWFGPCGSLALLAVYPRILREPCGGCQRATRIDLASCEHCGHSLDETLKTGIEIFDQPQTASEITAQPAAM